MQHMYIIGAQCTGKTTLVEAIHDWLSRNRPHISFTTIRETARTTLRLHQFNRDDVRAGGERCRRLQQLILQSQMDREEECKEKDLMISDRSGIDPLVYTKIYCGVDAAQEMSQSKEWMALKSKMREGTVIVCEPVEAWLNDDGVRLVPANRAEWLTTHKEFCQLLQQHGIPYAVLMTSVQQLDERVKFVLIHACLIDSSPGGARHGVETQKPATYNKNTQNFFSL